MDQLQQHVCTILPKSIGEIHMETLVEVLFFRQWMQDNKMKVEEAQELGLQVSTEMPEAVHEIMCLCKQSRQRRPSLPMFACPAGLEKCVAI
ncbi:MAG: hypothetical protein JXA25_05205 [Anaerolineales bacterium]|nr:hypothetical protein [Anaerolineales bacterium]